MAKKKSEVSKKKKKREEPEEDSEEEEQFEEQEEERQEKSDNEDQSEDEQIQLHDIDEKKVATKESISSLGNCLSEAERLFESIKDDLQRLEKMKATFERKIIADDDEGLFDGEEILEYKASLEFHGQLQRENVKTIVEKINTAKEIWEIKQRTIEQMWNDGVLDDGVVEKWKISMVNYENRIHKIDSKLQFWYGTKPVQE